MANAVQLPCDGDGVCMKCKATPSEEEQLICKTCVTPWHAPCLASPPESLASTVQWECPDCSTVASGDGESTVTAAGGGPSGELVAAIREIEADASLTEQEKAKRRQELVSGRAVTEEGSGNADEGVLGILDDSLKCAFCMQVPERPVTTPCGHNFCLKCFQKWIGQGKRNCAKCRNMIPPKMASQPRINSSLVVAIRMAKMSKSNVSGGPSKVYHFIHNENRPSKAFTTERAQKSGKANASSGKIFVTVPTDHFGPILAENDPERNLGVLVGESWEDRLECRQWGAHFPHVAGIAGQAKYGAQSVVLSGGYQDDEDHGEWFLYTGSGGRDLSGNKRTNKDQSFDQKFEKFNEALRVSCKNGYPVRVVRSFKEKRSSYAPEKGVRYDGIYRIEKCWRKVGKQGYKVCRYLFVRCDNDPAPWTSDEIGDRPRPLPAIKELKAAADLTDRKQTPSWDFDAADGRWKWIKPPPMSQKGVSSGTANESGMKRIRTARNQTVRERLLREFACLVCKQVMTLPVTTPCAHNFCKPCLEGAFAGKSLVRERANGRRSLRSQKNVMNCPVCTIDIADFLSNVQVNRELMDIIEKLKQQQEEESEEAAEESSDEGANGTEALGENGEDNPEEPDADADADDNDDADDASADIKRDPEPPLKRQKKRNSNIVPDAVASDGNHSPKPSETATKVEGNGSPTTPLVAHSVDDVA